jgi:hypothetical protein
MKHLNEASWYGYQEQLITKEDKDSMIITGAGSVWDNERLPEIQRIPRAT